VALVLVGCNDVNKPGGPGATAGDKNKPVVGTAEETFTLNPPNFSENIKQGESKVVSIGINRGKNFDQDVKLAFDNIPQGITIEPKSPAIKKGETEAKVTLKAAADAAVGTFTIKITGNPDRGAPASNELKITVEQK
jgi:uncharacterized membrane protein